METVRSNKLRTSPKTRLANWSQGAGSCEIENGSCAATVQVSQAVALGWRDCVAEYAAAGAVRGRD